ncbi:MAG: UDP-N-acetylmuramoyl-tripeptide--D-alanyl-D-alanine ligase, partial [Muribaculaceae bacterium]|nr:UDP-N-acetylmuramoyl-tripeptide--D-alanyl-D-alanine ligase [Muribaculaceae bacterium]
IENVQRTKFELVDALPQNGFAVLNNDFEYVASRKVDNVPAFRYGVANTNGCQYVAKDIKYSAQGSQFTIEGEGKSLTINTKLVGECNISNLMAAVILAMKLGVDDDKIRYAASKIEQVEHRLNLKRTPAGITIIDDAFNSNPDGSRMAVEVLGAMTGGKRIIITPGMIELGDKQEHYNRIFGEHIAKNCDIAIVVGQYNRTAIVNGIKSQNILADDKIILADTFAEAQQRMLALATRGDFVLYENDLPDTFK